MHTQLIWNCSLQPSKVFKNISASLKGTGVAAQENKVLCLCTEQVQQHRLWHGTIFQTVLQTCLYPITKELSPGWKGADYLPFMPLPSFASLLGLRTRRPCRGNSGCSFLTVDSCSLEIAWRPTKQLLEAKCFWSLPA